MDVRNRLSSSDIGWVTASNDDASTTDGLDPLGEHTLLQLKRIDVPSHHRHFLAEVDGKPVGYAFIEIVDGAASGELFIHPASRSHGFGKTLVEEVRSAASSAGAETLLLWAHGDLDPAQRLAESQGFSQKRVLFQLGRPLSGAAEKPEPPNGIELRAFAPHQDEEELLRVNAAAFVDHPEQGRLSLSDLRQRMSERWFDASGLVTAWRGDQMVGFHWTKTHPDGNGEVYVLAVDPQAQGMKLGRLLTNAGLEHLASRGLESVILYVDGSNTKAVQLYRNAGFTQRRIDVQYAVQLLDVHLVRVVDFAGQ